MSTPNFNGIDPWFDPFLLVWGLWGYWKKNAGTDRTLFLVVTLLAAVALGIRSFATGTVGYVAVVVLHWLAIVVVVGIVLTVKYKRCDPRSN